MSRLGIKILIIVVGAMIVFGCSGKAQLRPENSDVEKNKVKVAVISANNYNDNYNVFKNSMEEYGKKAGLELVWLDGSGNILKQEDAIENAAKQNVKVIVIEPVEPDLISNMIREMQNTGIKFVCLNTLPPDIGVEAYITPDFERAGEMQAQQLIKEIKDNRQVDEIDVLILRGQKDEMITERIITGNNRILQGNTKIKEIWIEEMSSRDIEEAYETIKKYLALPNPPAAIMTHFPEHTEGLLKAVNELPNDEGSKIITFGMGTQKEAIEAITKGSHIGEIDFMPDLFAQLVVKAVNSLTANELWEYETQIENGVYNVQARYSPIRLITKENIQLLKERMKKLEKNSTEPQENQKSKESNKKENNENTQENKTEQAEGKKKSIVIIKTKDGQEFKMDISGDIESIEMKGEEKQEGEGKGE